MRENESDGGYWPCRLQLLLPWTRQDRQCQSHLLRHLVSPQLRYLQTLETKREWVQWIR